MSIIEEDIKEIINDTIPWDRFNDTSVLITGANGNLPSYMVETLLNLKNVNINVKVVALVRNLEKAKARFKKYKEDQNLIFIQGNVNNPINIEYKIDYIIHAASQASPKYFNIDPVGTFNANVIRNK